MVTVETLLIITGETQEELDQRISLLTQDRWEQWSGVPDDHQAVLRLKAE